MPCQRSGAAAGAGPLATALFGAGDGVAGGAAVFDGASALGIAPSTRVVIDADAHPYPLEWLLAPLSVGSAIVLSTHTDLKKLAARAAAEKAALVAPSLP